MQTGDCRICPLQELQEQAAGAYFPEGPVVGAIIMPAPMHQSHARWVASELTKLDIDPAQIALLSLAACARGAQRAYPAPETIYACRPKFQHELAQVLRLEVPIVTFGQEAMAALGITEKLTTVQGYTYWLSRCRVLPTFHPYFVETNPDAYLDWAETLSNAFLYSVTCPVPYDVLSEGHDEPPWVVNVRARIKAQEKIGVVGAAYRKELDAMIPPTEDLPKTYPPVKYSELLKPEDVEQLITSIQARRIKHICLDIETSGFNPYSDRILCIALGISETEAHIVPYAALSEMYEVLRKLFALPGINWVYHNGKFDCRFLLAHPLLKMFPPIGDDTMLLHYTLDERIGTHGLKTLCRRKLGLPNYEGLMHACLPKQATSFKYIPPRLLHHYAAQDVCYTLRLRTRLLLELEMSPHEPGLSNVYQLLLRASNALTEIESVGCQVDVDAIDATETDFVTELARLHAALIERIDAVGAYYIPRKKAELKPLKSGKPRVAPILPYKQEEFNPSSSQQVAWFLYDVLGLPEVQLFRNHHDRATSHEALEKLLAIAPDEPFIQTLLRYRELAKIVSTYVKPIREAAASGDGRLHTDFKLHGTATGRLSAASPNLQNVPRPTKNDYAGQIRNFIVASPGYKLIGADYASMELRIAAEYSREPFWRDAFIRGIDMHSEMAKILFGPNFTKEHRMVAKMFVFGALYGRGAQSIAIERGMSVQQAQAMLNKFFENVPHAARWLKQIRVQAYSQGYLTTPVGRMRRFGMVNDANMGSVSSQAVNFPIQSLASDCCLYAFIGIHDWLKATNKGRALLIVHDAIYLEAPLEHVAEVEAKLVAIMEQAPIELFGANFTPFKADAHSGDRWGEL